MKPLRQKIDPELLKMIRDSNQKAAEKGKKVQAIRDRLMKTEQFKMQNIEGYVLDAYGIETKSIKELLKQYNLTSEYDKDFNLILK